MQARILGIKIILYLFSHSFSLTKFLRGVIFSHIRECYLKEKKVLRPNSIQFFIFVPRGELSQISWCKLLKSFHNYLLKFSINSFFYLKSKIHQCLDI